MHSQRYPPQIKQPRRSHITTSFQQCQFALPALGEEVIATERIEDIRRIGALLGIFDLESLLRRYCAHRTFSTATADAATPQPTQLCSELLALSLQLGTSAFDFGVVLLQGLMLGL